MQVCLGNVPHCERPLSLLCMFTNSLIESTLWEDPMRDNSFDRTIERNALFEVKIA
jgi:hypothetical protein